MPSSNARQIPATSASRSIRSFLHLQSSTGAAPAASKPLAPVNRLTDEFLRAVSGVGSSHHTVSKSGSIHGLLDEDVVAKMLSDGAQSRDALALKPSPAATDSNIRTRKSQASFGSVTPRSPRSSERRSRASAAVTSSSPKVAAATAVSEANRQMLRLQSKTVSRHLTQLSQRSDLSPATGLGLHTPVISLQVQPASGAASEATDNSFGSASARRDISAESALAVLADLAEIREMKAESLERSIERESVGRVPAAVHAMASTFRLIFISAGAH